MKKLLATTILAAALGSVPAYAQQAQQQSGQQGGDLTWEQEGSESAGPALRIGPSTVRQIQQALNNQGYDAGQIDGVWGEETQASIESYQRSNGLEPTGQPDINTLSALGIDVSGQQQGSGQQSGQSQQQGSQSQQPQSQQQGGQSQQGQPKQGQSQ